MYEKIAAYLRDRRAWAVYDAVLYIFALYGLYVALAY